MAAPPPELIRREGGKIVLLVIDGLGGLPDVERGMTEMQAAEIPHLDGLASRSSVGRLQMLPPGLTPGSGPGHLALFGYEPFDIDFGRGVLEALGSDYPLAPGEVASRGNFCTIDDSGLVQDRRAGRPSDAESRVLCDLLNEKVDLSGHEFLVLPGKQHRFTLILRGSELGHHVNDNDPQVEGKAPISFAGRDAASERTAGVVTNFFDQARRVLADQARATGVLLRGFSSLPPVQNYAERFGLRACAIAIYPMYRGVANLVGMEVLEPGRDLGEQIEVAREMWSRFDYFFIHTKEPDQAGHSGDFAAKVTALEAIDRDVPALEALGADALIVTGDHSTPCIHREHSWHPVPVLIHSKRSIPVAGTTFDECGVLGGDLGTIEAHYLTQLALAHADRLDKFGA